MEGEAKDNDCGHGSVAAVGVQVDCRYILIRCPSDQYVYGCQRMVELVSLAHERCEGAEARAQAADLQR